MNIKQYFIVITLLIIGLIQGCGSVATRAEPEKLTEDELAAKKERQKQWNLVKHKLTLNGPDGWIELRDGSREYFIRFGTLRGRHIPNFNRDLEEIQELDISKCCDIIVKEFDGSTSKINTSRVKFTQVATWLGERPNEYYNNQQTYELALVLTEKTTGQPYTKLFPHFNNIVKIEINGNQKEWNALPGGRIHTKLNFNDGKLIGAYKEEIRKITESLLINAKTNGWFESIPRNIPSRLLFRVRARLEAKTTSKWNCIEGVDLVNGVESLQKPIECLQATKEIRLINKGYALSQNATPIAYMLLLSEIKRDLN